MEESGSEGLDELIEDRKDTFFKVYSRVFNSRFLCNVLHPLGVTTVKVHQTSCVMQTCILIDLHTVSHGIKL